MKLTFSIKNHAESLKSLKLNKSKSNKKGIFNTITNSSLNKSIELKYKLCDDQQSIKKNLENKILQNSQNDKNLHINKIKTHILGQKGNRENKNDNKLHANTKKLSVFLNNPLKNESHIHKRNKSQDISHHLIHSSSQQSILSDKKKSQQLSYSKQNQTKSSINENINEVMSNKMKKIKNFMKNKNIVDDQVSLKFYENKQNQPGNLFAKVKTQNFELKQKVQHQNYFHNQSKNALSISFVEGQFIFQQGYKPVQLQDFAVGKKIGKGRFGNVFQIQHIETQSIYALKVLSKTQIKQEQMQQQIMLEIKLQSYLNHPNILKLYGFFDDFENIYLILEYATQSCLFKKLRKQMSFSQPKVSYYARQLIESMKSFHSEYILHRDIKPQNIMLTFDMVKLADFGWSVYSPVYKRQTFCGTVDYVSPEIIKGQYYDEKVDIWSLGILFYELAVGKAPFEGPNNYENETFQRILSNKLNFPNNISSDLRELIEKILTNNPAQRISLSEIESSGWMKTYELYGRFIEQQIVDFWKKLL